MFGEEQLYKIFNEAFEGDVEKILECIDSSSIRFLTSEWPIKINKQHSKETELRIAVQRVRNVYNMQEIKKLIGFGEENRIKIVFLKGLFLASELYEKTEIRQSKDIDVLIGNENFPAIHHYLRSQGYECENIADEDLASGRYEGITRKYHAIYNKLMGKMTITIEVHCSITNSGNAFEEHSLSFLHNSIQVERLGLKPWLLPTEYNLIFLAMHFIKHAPKYYLQKLLTEKHVELNLLNLLDIALLIEKNRGSINWDLILSESINMKVVEYVETVLCLVNSFYGQVVDTDFLTSLCENREYTKLNDVQFVEYGLGIFMWLFPDFLAGLRDSSAHQILKGEIGIVGRPFDYVKKYGMTMELNGNSSLLSRDFKIDFEDKPSAQLSINLSLSTEKIYISYSVFDKDCCRVQSTDDFFFEKDGVELLLVLPNSVIHYMFSMASDVDLIISSQNVGEGRKSVWIDGIDYDTFEKDNCFGINLCIPFHSICEYEKMDEVVINIGGLVSNPSTQSFTGNYMLFDSPGDFYNFSKLPVIGLK